jgi:hypothetical protein
MAAAMSHFPRLPPLLACLLLARPGMAAAEEIPPAYRLAARQANVPAAVLYAIALQESGIRRDGRFAPWPWTLNVAGRPRRFENHADACRALTKALRTMPPGRVDAGLAQINLGHQRHRYQHPCALLDPSHNLAAAASILREQYRPGEGWPRAIERYHRPAGGAPAIRYRQRVEKHLARILQAPPQQTRERTAR